MFNKLKVPSVYPYSQLFIWHQKSILLTGIID